MDSPDTDETMGSNESISKLYVESTIINLKLTEIEFHNCVYNLFCLYLRFLSYNSFLNNLQTATKVLFCD